MLRKAPEITWPVSYPLENRADLLSGPDNGLIFICGAGRVWTIAGNQWTAGGPFIACENASDHFRQSLQSSPKNGRERETGKRCSEFSLRIVSYRPYSLLQGLNERLQSRRPCKASPA